MAPVTHHVNYESKTSFSPTLFHVLDFEIRINEILFLQFEQRKHIIVIAAQLGNSILNSPNNVTSLFKEVKNDCLELLV